MIPPCTHATLLSTLNSVPDADMLLALDPETVRSAFPRVNAVCCECQEHVIAYASTAHFVAGDW